MICFPHSASVLLLVTSTSLSDWGRRLLHLGYAPQPSGVEAVAEILNKKLILISKITIFVQCKLMFTYYCVAMVLITQAVPEI